jgi:amylosucrase
VHRPARAEVRPAQCDDPNSAGGRIFQGLRKLIATRSATKAFAGGQLIVFDSKNASVLGFLRPAAGGGVLVLANFSEAVQTISREVLSGMPDAAVDLLDGATCSLRRDLSLAPYQMLWLQF